MYIIVNYIKYNSTKHILKKYNIYFGSLLLLRLSKHHWDPTEGHDEASILSEWNSLLKGISILLTISSLGALKIRASSGSLSRVRMENPVPRPQGREPWQLSNVVG